MRNLAECLRALSRDGVAESLCKFIGCLGEVASLRFPSVRNLANNCAKAGELAAVLLWEVRSGEERLFVRGKKEAHWPTAPPGAELHREPVSLVNIRPLFAVYFDA